MKKKITTDVAIMGSGLAGMAAAYQLAQQSDLKIAVFEKRPYQGGAVSNCPMSFMATPDTPEAMKNALRVMGQFTNYAGDLGLAHTVFSYSHRLPDLIFKELGIECIGVLRRNPEEYGNQRAYGIGFPNGMDAGDYFFMNGRGKGHAASLIILRLRRMLEKQGVEFYWSTPIQKIKKENGRVTGAYATDKESNEIEIECKALIVASGGISDSPELMKSELGLTRTDDNCSDGGDVTFIHFKNSKETGDGQKAIWEIGGHHGSISVSGHSVVPGPGIVNNIAWIEKNQLRIIQEQPYLWVDANGERFMNEEMTNQHMAIGAGLYRNPGHCGYVIFDEDTVKRWEKRGVEEGFVYFIFLGQKLQNIRGQMDTAIAEGNRHLWHADTVHEICEHMDINEKGLKETLKKYNSYAENGLDLEFGKNPRYLRPVREESGQIYCMRVHLGGYDTIGGVTINRRCEVLDTKKRIIPGLYSAGDMISGSLYGNPPINASSSLTVSMSTGLAAADNAIEYVKENIA